MSVMYVNNGSEETIGDLSHIFIGSRTVHNTRSTTNLFAEPGLCGLETICGLYCKN